MAKKETAMIPYETVVSKIYLIRSCKVMLDRDLADLYGVETKVLKQSVKRNLGRFPDDFMFEMTKQELENWRSQFVTSNSDLMGLRYAPYCFTACKNKTSKHKNGLQWQKKETTKQVTFLMRMIVKEYHHG